MLGKPEPLSIPGDSDLSPATPSVASIAGDAPSDEAAHREAITQTTDRSKDRRYELGTFDGTLQAGARA